MPDDQRPFRITLPSESTEIPNLPSRNSTHDPPSGTFTTFEPDAFLATGEEHSKGIRKTIERIVSAPFSQPADQDGGHPLLRPRMLGALSALGVCVGIGMALMSSHNEFIRAAGLLICFLGVAGAASIYWQDLIRIRIRLISKDGATPLGREIWVILAALIIAVTAPAALWIGDASFELPFVKSRQSATEWLLPIHAANQCGVNADGLRNLLLAGTLIARGHRVLVDDRGIRTAEKEIETLRPGDWQRLTIGGDNASAVPRDSFSGSYVSLEVAIVKPCR
jgi:hypothetical protein